MKTTPYFCNQMAEDYFQLEYSDTTLQQVLEDLPNKYRVKVSKVINLHYELKKPPSDAAGYVMRILRGPCKSLISRQEDN